MSFKGRLLGFMAPAWRDFGRGVYVSIGAVFASAVLLMFAVLAVATYFPAWWLFDILNVLAATPIILAVRAVAGIMRSAFLEGNGEG